MSRTIAAFTPVCDEDAAHFPDYLREAERLNMPFAIHFDRCSRETRALFRKHDLCVGVTRQDNPEIEYTEKHKQGVLDILSEDGYDWALHWDVDEIWERQMQMKLCDAVLREEDYLYVHWVNFWGDKEHVRVDGVFNKPPRVKLYNLQNGRQWVFDHKITYGCKLLKKGQIVHGHGVAGHTDIVCLHSGLMTRELREFHKARWDRILTAAVGNVPLGFWNLCLDEENHPPTIEKHNYR